MLIENEAILRFWIPALFIILSIPLILEKVRPNHIYGVRIKTTFSNDEIWYKANKICGWYLLMASIVLFAYRLLEPYLEILQNNFMGAVFIAVVIVTTATIFHISKMKV